MRSHKAVFGLLVFSLLVGFSSAVHSEEEDASGAKVGDLVKSRTYIGGFGTSTTIDQWGDFNGTNAFVFNGGPTVVGGVTYISDPEIDEIPSITRQFGWGALLGHREGPWAAELSFWRSEHTATYISAGPVTSTMPASLQAVNIDFKRYFFTQLPVQPFVSMGLSFPWLWVRQASFLTDTASPPNVVGVDDETISGIGMNLGAGLELYLGDNFSIFGGAYQRWAEFDQINGAAKIPLNAMYFDNNPTHIGSLAGNGLNFFVGTSVAVE